MQFTFANPGDPLRTDSLNQRVFFGSKLYLPILIVGFFYWFVARSFFANGAVPGDLGDARFNIYVLEHLFQWIRGHEPSLSSPGMFYPYPGTLFFSDTHAGSAIFYIIFRAAGISEFRSFTLWFFVGYLLTFLSCYVVALKFGYTAFLSAVIAIIFSFSLPSLAQFGHSQLVYRFAIPLAFLSCWRFVNTGSVKHLLWLINWVGLQALISFYLGIFLVIAVIIFVGSSILINRHDRRIADLARDLVLSTRQIFTRATLSDGFLFAFTTVTVTCTLALAAAYLRWKALYGLKRGWSEISTMLPQPASYFFMDPLPYWKEICDFLIHANVPARHEHNLFMGPGVFGLFIAGLASIFAKGLSDKLSLPRSSIMTLGILVFLTTFVDHYSPYYILTYIPGLNAIRSVTRISVVEMFFVAIVAAEGLRILANSTPRAPGVSITALFLTLSVLDILMIRKPQFSAEEAELRTVTIVEEARRSSNGKANPVLALMEEGEAPYNVHLDAMFAAQRLGWPTSNGYSGNSPPGYEYKPACDTPTKQFDAYEKWHHANGIGPDLYTADLLNRIIRFGSPACATDGNLQLSFGPPPNDEVARDLQLSPVSFELHGDNLAVELDIHNGGDRRVSAVSFYPIRLSWRFVPTGYDDPSGDRISWDQHRLPITGDLLPKTDLRMKIASDIPKKPGTYQLEVSMVAERLFWFHDKGMRILRFQQPIVVR